MNRKFAKPHSGAQLTKLSNHQNSIIPRPGSINTTFLSPSMKIHHKNITNSSKRKIYKTIHWKSNSMTTSTLRQWAKTMKVGVKLDI